MGNDFLIRKIFARNKKDVTYDSLYNMYFSIELGRLVNLFKWTGLPFPSHELDVRAFIDGFAGCVDDVKKGIMTAWGGMSGPTEYTDYFKKFTYSAPTASGGTFLIGEKCAILRNTSLSMSMFSWLSRYADLYAHNDLSMRMTLINSRYQDILKTTDSAKTEQITDWYDGLYNGKLLAIVDETPLSEFIDNSTGSISALDLTSRKDIDFTRFTELENELTRTFYRDIGVRWNKDKKANLVAGEVEQDNMLLKFNINDMLHSRERFCDDYKKAFGIKISVELNVKLEEGVVSSESNNYVLSGNDTE